MTETSTVELLAFDYDRQQWLEGEPARPVLIRQAEKELATLQGPKAKEYARFANITNIPKRIATLQAQLARLKAGAK